MAKTGPNDARRVVWAISIFFVFYSEFSVLRMRFIPVSEYAWEFWAWDVRRHVAAIADKWWGYLYVLLIFLTCSVVFALTLWQLPIVCILLFRVRPHIAAIADYLFLTHSRLPSHCGNCRLALWSVFFTLDMFRDHSGSQSTRNLNPPPLDHQVAHRHTWCLPQLHHIAHSRSSS